MSNKLILIWALFLLLASCASHRKTQKAFKPKRGSIESYCDSLQIYKTLYINKINADFSLGDEDYEVRMSIYYVPDSIFLISAVNAGFEIARMAVMKDSTMYINRLEKTVYIYRNTIFDFPQPIDFNDFELLINRSKLCNIKPKLISVNDEFVVDQSGQDLNKELHFSKETLALKKFEFFQKKTSEYVVGERTGANGFLIYSNYLLDDLMLKTSGGNVEYDKEIEIDLELNRNKYEFIYL